MKAKCNKYKILELLDGKKLNWLREQLPNYNIKLEQPSFSLLINNKADWKLTYALVIAKILNVKVEDIFYLK